MHRERAINDQKTSVSIKTGHHRPALKPLTLYLIISTLFILLFVGGETEESHRLMKALWDAGHLLLFALITYSYFRTRQQTGRIKRLVITTLFCGIIGMSIEVIQLLFDRDFSYNDAINDILGGYLGLISLEVLNRKHALKKRSLYTLLFIVLSLVGLRQLEKDLLDEYQQYQQFPILANFENRLELSRWEHTNTDISLSQEHTQHGSQSLKVIFLPSQYPTINLKYFQTDWSQYRNLLIAIYNPDQKPCSFVLKIFDIAHKKHYDFNDRLNKRLMLQPGWNVITTPINEIASAPEKRTMDIRNIASVSLFTIKPDKPVTLFIDNIRLVK